MGKHILHDDWLFINREEERNILEEVLGNEEYHDRIFEFTAIAGQGKTELLKYLCDATRERSNCLVAYVDVYESTLGRPEISPILSDIAESIISGTQNKKVFGKFDASVRDYNKCFSSYHVEFLKNPKTANRQAVEEKERSLITHFKAGLNKLLSKGYKIVLCFDATEFSCCRVAMQRFEEQVLQELIVDKNLIVFFAGQQRWRCVTRELRRQITRQPLLPFTRKYSEQFIEDFLSRKNVSVENKVHLFYKTWDLTKGHPFSTYKMLDSLTAGFEDKHLSKRKVTALYPKIITELIEKVIKNRVLYKMKLNSAYYPPPEKILLYISPLRRIEFYPVSFILSRFLPDWFKDKPGQFVEELIADFQKQTHVLATKLEFGASSHLEEVTRNILLFELQINRNKELIKILNALIKEYDVWIKQTEGDSQIKYIIDRLYYKVRLMRVEDKENIVSIIADELHIDLDRYFVTNHSGSEHRIDCQFERLKEELSCDEELKCIIDIEKLISILNQKRN
ncbi:MAG: hypothetical protein SD837_09275 [Candidatus Electrothrix scaldis]|nr:MAG: hypothetical protein SD837_09275 [Candidatus Electrothrix sp. GW3-3]